MIISKISRVVNPSCLFQELAQLSNMLTTVSNEKPSILNLPDSNRSFLSFQPGYPRKNTTVFWSPWRMPSGNEPMVWTCEKPMSDGLVHLVWSCIAKKTWLYYQSHMFEWTTACYYKYVSTSTCLTNAHTHTFVYFSNQSELIVVIPNYSYYGFKIMWIQVTESDNHLFIDQILHFCCVAIPHF